MSIYIINDYHVSCGNIEIGRYYENDSDDSVSTKRCSKVDNILYFTDCYKKFSINMDNMDLLYPAELYGYGSRYCDIKCRDNVWYIKVKI